jgi:Na+/H+ antiporter NhaD/arsenite permease-like protein
VELVGELRRLALILALSMAIAVPVVACITIPETGYGARLLELWRELRGSAPRSRLLVSVEEVVSLGLFIFVIATMVVDMRYRHFSAFAALAVIALSGTVPAQRLIESVDWPLIVFLIGSLCFAAILRKLGVFTYVAAHMVRLSRGRATVLVALLCFLAWFTAMVVDEVTSVVYVVMIVLELGRLLRVDVEELAVLSVLATNTGSAALPVGNPIGIYIAFSTGLTVADFVRRALPVSALCLGLLLLVFRALRGSYLRDLQRRVSERREYLEAFVTARTADLTPRERLSRIYGLLLLVSFLVTVSASPRLAEFLSATSGTYVDANALLSLVPYLFIVLTLPFVELPEYGEVIARGVEWPSIAFFMALFMLGYSLTWSGAMVKLAYAITRLGEVLGGGVAGVGAVVLVLSAGLSAVLDNLSLVVALTPALKLIANVLGARGLYWFLLFGGVFGGNLTPVGSTANIVAVSILERRARRSVSWGRWVRLAAPVVVAQCTAALVWAILTAG